MNIISYEEARDQVKNGDIIFVHSKGTIIDKLIMFFTRSSYVHVGIAFWIFTDEKTPKRLMIVEAQGNTKRRILNLSFYSPYGFDVISSLVSWDSIEASALARIGIEKYSYITAIYVGAREFLLKRFNIRLPKMKFDGEICSEFVARLLKENHTEVSPQALFKNLSNEGCQIKIKVKKD